VLVRVPFRSKLIGKDRDRVSSWNMSKFRVMAGVRDMARVRVRVMAGGRDMSRVRARVSVRF
jgi:hypothetical protein